MANKTLGINLQFNADTTAAITNLKNLQQSINAIAATPIPIGSKISAEMQTAIQSAKQLQLHLNNAFNTQTGNLDLSKLNASLMASGQNLSTLSANLLGAGMKGEQAFINIQRAISTANVQINTASTALGRFMTTLKNTAKWQISSSLLHGFIGGIQSAISYTKDLDKSLNSIRIVTGYNTDVMADFAVEANKAAKALNTTTAKYADASLIYFQQGLSMDEVKERNETTIKLANVSRQSLEETANQLTAIWNNFDDGTKSLEYYADVMTKLGATTASSTKEIAGGLEKFISIADTIGLSYEYAASALATITANTRQSEEVVGTALKTIFARIQGLKLGETLEDGVELNKYSEALAKIGVDILDVNGNLIDADQILEKTAKRWETLTDAQKAATAQTVAGIRQYNQFISLMDNWDDGTSDSMVANLSTSFGAEGELQEQADRYAESWEAASAKMKASMESVWNNLIPTEGIVDFTNGMAEVVDILASAIKGFGGFQSILLLIANIALTKLGPSIAIGIDQGLNKMQEFGINSIAVFKQLGSVIAHPIASFKKWQSDTSAINNSFTTMNGHLNHIVSQTGNATEQTKYFQENLQTSNNILNQSQAAIAKAADGTHILTDTFRSYIGDMAQANNLQALIAKNSHLLTASAREQLSGMQQQLLVLADKKAQQKDTLELLEAEKRTIIEATNARMQSAYTSNSDGNQVALMNLGPMNEQLLTAETGWARLLVAASGVDAEIVQGAQGLQLQANTISDVHQAVMGVRETSSNVISITEEIRNIYKDTTLSIGEQSKKANDLIARRVEEKTITSKIGDQLRSQLGILDNTEASAQEIESRIRQIVNENNQVARGFGDSNAQINNMNSNATGLVNAMEKWRVLSQEFKNQLANIATTLRSGLQGALSWGGALQGMAQGASRVAMGLNSVMNFIEQIKSGDADFTTVLVSGTMALSMGLSGLMTILGGINTLITTQNSLKAISNMLDKAKIANVAGEITVETAETIATELGIKADEKDAFVTGLVTASKERKNVSLLKLIASQLGLNAAMAPMLIILAGVALAIGLVVGGLKLADVAYNADAKAAEKAGEAAKKAAQQFQEAQEKYNEFKDSISKYDEAVKGLAELTKGTIEYKEQIMKANEEALKLINSQNLLYGTDYGYDENGMIEFYGDSLKKAQEQEFNNLERLEANKSFTAQRAKTAEEKANLTEFARNNLNDDKGWQSEDWGDTAKVGGWALGGAALGAAIGIVIPVIGNAVGAAIGAAIGAGAGLIAGTIDMLNDDVKGDSSDNEIQSMRKLAEAYDKQGEEALTPENMKKLLGEDNAILEDVFAKPTVEMTKALMEEKGISEDDVDMNELNNMFEEMGDAITPEDLKAYFDRNGIAIDQESIDQMFESVIDPEVKSQIASLAANTAAIRAHVERTSASANQDNEAYQNLSDEDKSIADKIIANRVDDALADPDSDAYAKLEEDALKAWQKETGATKGFFKGDENLTYDKYMEITYGKDWKDNYKVENMAGTNATVYKKDEDGKWVNIDPDDKKNTLSNDEVKAAIVEYYAKQYNNEDAQNLAKISNQAQEITSNVAGASNTMAYDIKSALASGETVDFSFMTPEQISELKREINNGTIEISDEYKDAIMNGIKAWSQEAHEARMEAEANSVISEGASKYGLDEETLRIQANLLQQTHEGLNNNAVAAAEMAVANQRMNQGVKKLCDNWEDWSKTLKSSDKTTQDYAEAIAGAHDAIKTMLGLTEDAVIPADFLQAPENLELLDEISKGSEEALEKLHFNLTKAQIESEKFSTDIAQNMVNAFDFGDDVNLAATFNEMKNQALSALTEIQAMANGLDVGAGLKDPAKQAELAAKLNEYAMAAGWTAEQMQSALSSVGVRAKITMVEGNPTVKQIPITKIERKRIKNNIITGEQAWQESAQVIDYKEVTEPTLVPQIEMEDPNNPGGQTTPIFEKVDMGNIAPSATTSANKGGGGGGSSAKPAEDAKKDDIVERYKEIEDAIDDVADAMDDASKEADRLYGKGRIDKMKEANKQLEKEIDLLKQKKEKAKENLQTDLEAFKAAAQAAGVSFDLENYNITNYTEQMTQLYNQLQGLISAANADGNADEQEQSSIDKLQKLIDNLKEKMSQYEETRELIEDLDNEIRDKEYERQDNNYEILHYEMEVEIELNDLELEKIDYYLSKIADDFYAMAEAAQYMNKQIPVMTESLSHYENFYNNITAAYAADEISQAAYVEGMQEAYSAILDQLSALNDLDNEMMHYYEDTLSAASDELSQFTDQMEHLTSVLDHYQSIVELINGEYDYESIGTILEGRAKTLKNELDVATANYQMLLSEREAAEEAYRNAQDEAARELYAAELKAITTQVNEAHDLMLSKTEEWAEAAKAIMENTMAKAARELEMALTDNRGFDAINSSMERLSSYADEVLTKTNQIYETQTLMNTIQKSIDKTTNEAAKRRLKAYQDEIKVLQEKNELSNFELEIAKAKYDVLQAEIALEEAQNAKATVRLKRDSEGNYGYVYTANQEAIADAEQELLDAQNALYNVGLEGANEYGQAMVELKEETLQALQELAEAYAIEGNMTEEEYQKQREEIIQEAYRKYTLYSNNYSLALKTDSNIAKEAWVADFINMDETADTWMQHVTDYISECEGAYSDWRDTVETESDVIDEVLNDLEEEVNDVTDASDELKEEVVNEVIPAIKDQLTSVRDVTSAYANQRTEIQNLISYYEQLTQSILEAIQAQAAMSAAAAEQQTHTYNTGPADQDDISPDKKGDGDDDRVIGGGLPESPKLYQGKQRLTAQCPECGYKYDTGVVTKTSSISQIDANTQALKAAEIILNDKMYHHMNRFGDKREDHRGLIGKAPQRFDTGGYTGSWGPEGKLATLHEKELVLNKADTKNILSTVGIVRSISDQIEAYAKYSTNINGNFLPNILNGGQILEQQVSIEAHFPNATNHSEIEEAFNNLINTASQFANRKNL